MTYAQIRAFYHVALNGGFSAAAQALGLTQPAISDQVRKLEQDHDVLLFSRARRKVTLTPDGEALLAKARAFFAHEEDMRGFLSETASRIEDELCIMVDSASHISGIVQRFRIAFPSVRIHLSAGNTEEVLQRLRAFEADIGVIGSHEDFADMDAVALSESELVAFARADFFPPEKRSISLAELTKHPLVLREAGSRTRQMLEDFGQAQGIAFKPAVVAEGREAVREIVASSGSIGIVSRAEMGEDRRIRALELQDMHLVMRERVVHLRQRQNVRVIREFMRLCRPPEGDVFKGPMPPN